MRHISRRKQVFAVSAAAGCAVLGATTCAAQAQETGASAGGNPLQEVVVTATRQSVAISKVPVSVSAFTQESMQVRGMKSFADVARFTPGVEFDGGPNANTITIRGISSGAGSGTTGIYLDDTPIQMRALGFSADDTLPAVFDLERVEVLRGPQGTLFGAGSEGGTVRYITVQPSLTEFTGRAVAELASTRYGELSYETGAAFGGPLVADKVGVRMSGWYRRDGGYIDRVNTNTGATTEKDANHSKVASARAALTWQPVENLAVTPSVLYQKRTVHDTDDYFVALSKPRAGTFRNGSPEMDGSSDKFYLPALLISYDLGPISLISNTSYFRRDNETGYDGTLYNLSYYQGGDFLTSPDCTEGLMNCRGDLYPLLTPTGVNPELPYYLSPSLVTNTQRTFTQEFRAQSNDSASKLTWVAGVFFQRSRQRSIEELIDPLGNDLFRFLFDGVSLEELIGYPLYPYGGHLDSYIAHTAATDKQTAVFADLTYKFTDSLKFTVGGRYAKTQYEFRNFADGSQNFEPTEAEGRSSEKPFTPKAGLSYQLNEDNLLYLTYAEGFRAGGANAPVPFAACGEDLADLGLTKSPDTYKSDSVKSWEIGFKSNLFERRVQLAASAYEIRWSDIQEAVFLPGCAIQFTGNLGEAASRGFDIQATLRPLEGLTIDATIGHTDAYYTEPTQAGSAFIVSDGDGLGIAPWTYSVGIEQSFLLLDHEGYVRADYEYTSKLDRVTSDRNPADQAYDPALVAPPETHFVSLRVGAFLGSANVALFVDNLFDSSPRLTYTNQGTGTVLFQASTWRPRTVGLNFTYEW